MTRQKRDYWREASAGERAVRAKAAKQKRRRQKKGPTKPDVKERQPGLIKVAGRKRVGDSRAVNTRSGHFKKRTGKAVPREEAVLLVKRKRRNIKFWV
jgi:hypothetical protein